MQHTPKNLGTCVLGLLLLVAVTNGSAQPSLDVSHATNNCVRFTFPPWEFEGLYDFSGRGHLEFRTTGDAPDELLVAGRYKIGYSSKNPAQYSKDKFRISLTRPGEAISVADEIWEESEILNPFPPATSSTEAYEFGQRLNPEGFEFNGKLVKLRGKYWGGRLRFHAIHNPSKRYVALQSMTGRVLRDNEVYAGKAFVQVFDTQNGREIFWLEGRWKEDGSAVVFGNTEWVREDLLAVTFDPWLRRGLALCTVP